MSQRAAVEMKRNMADCEPLQEYESENENADDFEDDEDVHTEEGKFEPSKEVTEKVGVSAVTAATAAVPKITTTTASFSATTVPSTTSSVNTVEKKRVREKKRRGDITHAIDDLVKLLVEIDPSTLMVQNKQVLGIISSNGSLLPIHPSQNTLPHTLYSHDGNASNTTGGVGTSNPLSAGRRLRASMSGEPVPLNRTDIILHAAKVLERIHRENEDYKKQIHLLTTLLTQQMKPSPNPNIQQTVATAAATTASSSNSHENKNRNDSFPNLSENSCSHHNISTFFEPSINAPVSTPSATSAATNHVLASQPTTSENPSLSASTSTSTINPYPLVAPFLHPYSLYSAIPQQQAILNSASLNVSLPMNHNLRQPQEAVSIPQSSLEDRTSLPPTLPPSNTNLIPSISPWTSNYLVSQIHSPSSSLPNVPPQYFITQQQQQLQLQVWYQQQLLYQQQQAFLLQQHQQRAQLQHQQASTEPTSQQQHQHKQGTDENNV